MKNYTLNHLGKGFTELENFLNDYDIELDEASDKVLFDELMQGNYIDYFCISSEFDGERSYLREEDTYSVYISVAIDNTLIEFSLIGYTTQETPLWFTYDLYKD